MLLAAGLLFTACGDDTDSTLGGEVEVSGAWVRTSPMDAANGAAYLTITSPVDDAILSVSVDASVAAAAELHETVMAEPTGTTMAMGTDMDTGTTMAMGEMTMREVEEIALPAATAVALAPGGLHVMLLDLVEPLEVGDTITVTLTLESAGELMVEVPVLDEAP
jgi:copper(I)-binding protein